MKSTAATSKQKYLEAYTYHWCLKEYLPHGLNPRHEVYWICHLLLEYLVKMVRITVRIDFDSRSSITIPIFEFLG
jgi:hypothetical protein